MMFSSHFFSFLRYKIAVAIPLRFQTLNIVVMKLRLVQQRSRSRSIRKDDDDDKTELLTLLSCDAAVVDSLRTTLCVFPSCFFSLLLLFFLVPSQHHDNGSVLAVCARFSGVSWKRRVMMMMTSEEGKLLSFSWHAGNLMHGEWDERGDKEESSFHFANIYIPLNYSCSTEESLVFTRLLLLLFVFVRFPQERSEALHYLNGHDDGIQFWILRSYQSHRCFNCQFKRTIAVRHQMPW